MSAPENDPSAVTTPPDAYAGQRLGLPPSGPGSLATFGRRFVGVLIDWLVAQLLVRVFAPGALSGGRAGSFLVLAVFGVMTVLCLSVVAASFGHYVMGLQLRQVRPGNFPWQVLIRTLLLCLFLPAVITGPDGRGFHDIIAGTVLVRR